MRIRSITVDYGCTHSLPDYCNVKPSITVTADLEGEETFNDCIHVLEQQCERHVHEIIDGALEAEGLSPEFSNEPLFRLYRWEQRDEVLVILPDEIKDMTVLPGHWRIQRNAPQRYDTLLGYARKRWPHEAVMIIRDEEELQHLIWDWWNARTWYNLWFAYEYEGPWNNLRAVESFAVATVLSPQSLETADLFREPSGYNIRCPMQLPDLERELDTTVSADLPRHVLSSQVELDEFVNEWIEEHPRPAEADELDNTDTASLDTTGYVGEGADYYGEDDYPEDDYKGE